MPGIRIIAFAVGTIEDELIACAEAGIFGYLTRDASVDDLVMSLCAAVSGEVICSARHVALLVEHVAARHRANPETRDNNPLTHREREIAVLVNEGMSNKDIARSLRIGAATVKNHVHNILAKLQVKTRGEAAASLRSADRTAHPRRAAVPQG
jgi:DNA-binding NarL/FixJ family response regulator